MREVTKVIKLFPYDELSDEAKANARQHLVDELATNGVQTEAMRTIAADWLTNEGWTDLAELRWIENGPDLEKMQFSIGHVQGDYVVWNSSRPWEYKGFLITVHTKIAGTWQPVMDVDISGFVGTWQQTNELLANARAMVREHQSKVMHVLHEYDLSLIDDEEYLADHATANEIEFTEAGSIYR